MNKYYWIVALIMIVVLLQGFYLISYIKQTTIEYDSPIKEQLDKDLEELEKYNEIGPDVDEYLKSVQESIKKYGCQIKKDK